MATSTIALNQVPNEPSLNDLLNVLKKEIFFDLNCVHVATIQSFSSSNQTVTATVNYTQTYFKLNSVTGLYDPYQENYPLAVDCPVIVLGGGNANLTFPIAEGDECLLLFNDRDINNWFSGSAVGPVATGRAHAFSDAFALIGVNSLANSISGYDTTRAVLQQGTTMVGVGPTLIKIANATGSLNTIFGELYTALSTLSTALSTASTLGQINAAGTAAGIAITAARTALGGILE